MTDGDLAWKHQIPPWADSWAVGEDEVIGHKSTISLYLQLPTLTNFNKLIYQSGSSNCKERRQRKERGLMRQRNTKCSWRILLTWSVMRSATRKFILSHHFYSLPLSVNSSLIHQTEWDIWKHRSHHALLEQFRGNTAETRMDEPPTSRRSLLGAAQFYLSNPASPLPSRSTSQFPQFACRLTTFLSTFHLFVLTTTSNYIARRLCSRWWGDIRIIHWADSLLRSNDPVMRGAPETNDRWRSTTLPIEVTQARDFEFVLPPVGDGADDIACVWCAS